MTDGRERRGRERGAVAERVPGVGTSFHLVGSNDEAPRELAELPARLRGLNGVRDAPGGRVCEPDVGVHGTVAQLVDELRVVTRHERDGVDERDTFREFRGALLLIRGRREGRLRTLPARHRVPNREASLAEAAQPEFQQERAGCEILWRKRHGGPLRGSDARAQHQRRDRVGDLGVGVPDAGRTLEPAADIPTGLDAVV